MKCPVGLIPAFCGVATVQVCGIITGTFHWKALLWSVVIVGALVFLVNSLMYFIGRRLR